MKANIQPLGISVDSRFSHLAWGVSLGGISLPLLSDFHPKGQMAQSYKAYMDDKGITKRATVFIDASGKVRFSEAVSSGRDMDALANKVIEMVKDYDGPSTAAPSPTSFPDDTTLYVRNNCAASRAVLATQANLHLSAMPTKNVSIDNDARAELQKLTGKETAPVLMRGGKPLPEAAAIIEEMVHAATGW